MEMLILSGLGFGLACFSFGFSLCNLIHVYGAQAGKTEKPVEAAKDEPVV